MARRLASAVCLVLCCGQDPSCKEYTGFKERLLAHYAECQQVLEEEGTDEWCLPRRVSLMVEANMMVDAILPSDGPLLPGAVCPDGMLSALALVARPLLHTAHGHTRASAAFVLACHNCWPTLGSEAAGWPVSYQEILDLVLDSEAWEDVDNGAAEWGHVPPLPPPMIHQLTPSVPHGEEVVCRVPPAPLKKRVHILSTGHHASYPAAVYHMLQGLLKDVQFELEDHSFDHRYCELTGTCTVDDRFSWLGESLRSTVVETCGGRLLKGFEDISAMAEYLFHLLTSGPDPITERADVLLCTHPPYSCRLFWPFVQRLGKPLLGFFGGTLEAHVPGSGIAKWLTDFREMAQHPLVQFAAISPFLAEKMRYQTSVDIPAARGFGFHVVAQGMSYFPRRMGDVLMWKNSFECLENRLEMDALLSVLAAQEAQLSGEEPLRFHHLRDLRESGESSYASIASFRAVVMMPYEVLLMAFYELYHVAMPMFVPSLALAAFQSYRGPVTFPHCSATYEQLDGDGSTPLSSRPRAAFSPFKRTRATDRVAWLNAYSDWFRFPYVLTFSTLAELLHKLRSEDLQAVSAAMRLETEGSISEAAGFWRSALTKVLGAVESS